MLLLSIFKASLVEAMKILTFFGCFLFFADAIVRPRLIREKRNPPFKIVAKGYSADIDCRFKAPYSLDDVTLSKELATMTQVQRIVDGVKITKSGQIFTINDVQMSDEGSYWCRVGRWSLKIERLYVVSRTQPGVKYVHLYVYF